MIKHYASVYMEFLRTSLAKNIGFRTNFVLLLIMDIIFYFTTLAGIDFIYNHIETIGPWRRDQLLFFASFMLALDNLHMTFISENFWIFSDDLKQGKLDFVLLKPIHAIFIVFFSHIRSASMLSSLFAWSCLIYFGLKVDLNWIQWTLIPFLLLAGLAFQVILEIIFSTTMIWVIDGVGINFLRMEFQRLSKWPDFIYQKVFRRIFTFAIPILLIGSAPVNILLGQSVYYYLVSFCVLSVIMYVIMIRFWRFAIRHYESASS